MKEKELKLEIEELEERIAPTFIIDPSGNGHGQGDPDVTVTPPQPSPSGGRGAWNAHDHSDVIDQ